MSKFCFVKPMQPPNMSVKRIMKEQVVEWKVLVYSTFLIIIFIPEVFVTQSTLVMGTAKHTKGWLHRSPIIPTYQ
jgi:hypothetical protein